MTSKADAGPSTSLRLREAMNFRQLAVLAVLAVYKYAISPVMHAVSGPGAGCRFQPTCSEYAAVALQQHGLLRGGWLVAGRLLRCHPFARGGLDLVPMADSDQTTRAI